MSTQPTKTPSPSATSSTDAELLDRLNKGREKHAAQKEKLIRFQAARERAEKDLEAIKKEGMEKFQSSSPVEIKTRLDTLREQNIANVETFLREQESIERQLAAMDAALDELEKQVSKA